MYEAILTKLPVNWRLSLFSKEILMISLFKTSISLIKGFLNYSSTYNGFKYLIYGNSF